MGVGGGAGSERMDAKKRRLNARTGGLPLDQVLHPTAVSYIEFTNDAMTLRQTSNPSSGWRQTKPPASPSLCFEERKIRWRLGCHRESHQSLRFRPLTLRPAVSDGLL